MLLGVCRQQNSLYSSRRAARLYSEFKPQMEKEVAARAAKEAKKAEKRKEKSVEKLMRDLNVTEKP